MKLFKHIVLLLLSIFSVSTFFAQNYTCNGFVIDSITSNPLSNVTVQLLKFQDSTFYTGTITDDEGLFLLQNLSRGDYLCRFSYVGYQKKEINITIGEIRGIIFDKPYSEFKEIDHPYAKYAAEQELLRKKGTIDTALNFGHYNQNLPFQERRLSQETLFLLSISRLSGIFFLWLFGLLVAITASFHCLRGLMKKDDYITTLF
jgi:hypothetical protein